MWILLPKACRTALLFAWLLAPACLPARAAEQEPPEAAVAAEHLEAAHSLLKTMKMDVNWQDSLARMVDVQIAQNPAIAPYRQVMLDFFKQYMPWDNIKDDMARIYADEFTREELLALADFYRTPVGQKAAARLPVLMQKGAELGMNEVQKHLPKLQQMILEEKQRQAQTPPTAQ